MTDRIEVHSRQIEEYLNWLKKPNGTLYRLEFITKKNQLITLDLPYINVKSREKLRKRYAKYLNATSSKVTRKPMCMCPRCVYHREYSVTWTSKACGKPKTVALPKRKSFTQAIGMVL